MNVLLYPYTDALATVVQQLLSDSSIEHVNIVGVGNYTTNVEAAENISFYKDFKLATENIDEVLIAFSNNSRLHQRIIQNIMYVLSHTACVVHCFEPLSCEELSSFDSYIRSNRLICDYIEELHQKDIKTYTPVETVVVVFSSLFPCSDSFYATCRLRNELVKKGYKVTVVSTSRYAKMAGFCQFPLGIIQNNTAIQSAVLSINDYFTSIEELYAPDIILLHLNVGMLKYSDICHEDFGAVAFAISQSLTFDYSILNIPMSELDVISKENIHKIKSFLKYRFGFQLDAVLVSANAVNPSESEESGHIVYDRISDIEANKVFDSFEESSGIALCGLMQDHKIIPQIINNCLEELSKGTDEF